MSDTTSGTTPSTPGNPSTPSTPGDLGGPQAEPAGVVRATGGIDPAAERWTRLPQEGDRIVLLLHGLGSTEDDLFAFAPYLPSDLVLVSLRGIFAYGPGWAWLDFPVDPSDRSKLSASAAAIEDWAEQQMGTVVGAIGFSQGAILTYELLRRRRIPLEWVAPLSGAPFPGELPGDAQLRESPLPAFWGHGAMDPLFGPEIARGTRAWMEQHTQLTEVLSPALGHGVDDRVLGGLVEFVQARPVRRDRTDEA